MFVVSTFHMFCLSPMIFHAIPIHFGARRYPREGVEAHRAGFELHQGQGGAEEYWDSTSLRS